MENCSVLLDDDRRRGSAPQETTDSLPALLLSQALVPSLL